MTDALCATKAAIAEGIVVGGGAALLYASRSLDKLKSDSSLSEAEKAGVKIVQESIRVPIKTIAENAGYEGSLILAKLLEQNDESLGYDAHAGKYVDMIKSGIVDPTKVIRTSLQDASSVASLMMTTDCIIYDEPEKKEKKE